MNAGVIDFARSYVTFVTPGRTNNARIQVECACTLVEPGKAAKEYLLLASCKSEEVYVQEGLFKQPNYDFCGVFSEDEYAIIRTHATADEGGYEIGRVAERFEELHIHVERVEGRMCEGNREIVEATLANAPLVARTELADLATGVKAALEYPIKTMNVNDVDNVFQVDAGPVALPDLAARDQQGVERLRLAFVAFNRPESAEFILQAPTAVKCRCGEETTVMHYSEVRETASANTVIAVGG